MREKYEELWGRGEMTISELLDAYAHGLAEKIRNSEVLRDYTDGHMDDCNQAARLIDPKGGH